MKNESSNAWYIAIQRHISTLPPEQKHAFNAPASAEDCLLLIEKAQIRSRKFDRLANALRPLVVPLKRFEGSIDTLVQTQSLFLSPIWGPLRCVLGLVSDRLASLASITTLLERLVDPLKRFQNYERLFEDNTSLRVAIGSLYCDLIEFCSRVVSHCTKSVLRKNFGNFDRDVQEISSKIRHHWNEVDVVANAANLAEAKAARQAEELERALQRKIEINRWLAPANVCDDLHRLLSSYQEGSCDWILQSPEFSRLEEATNFHALRITGHPGGGKSTAASFLVNHLLSSNGTASKSTAVLYFFCKASDTDKTFASTILRTCIFQLLQTCPSLATTVQQAFYRSGRSVLDSETETFAIFETLISQATSLPVYIILDAVDECRDAHTLLKALLELPKNAGLPFKVIILGREDPGLKIPLQSCDDTLDLHSQTQPLHQYIQTRVSKLSIAAHISDSQRQILISTITTTSAGLWLFASMLLDEISCAYSPEDITRQLQNIPKGMLELYTSLLRRREARFTPAQTGMAQQIYLWLSTSDYLPPHLWNTTHGDALDDQMCDLLLQYASASSTIFGPMSLVRELCTALVQIRVLHPGFMMHHHDGKDDDASIYVAEFFHQTAKAYLRWSIDALPASVPESLALRRLGHLHRGVGAVWYFTQSSEFKSEVRRLRERPRDAGDSNSTCMMNFSCGFWRALDVRATDSKSVAGYEKEVEGLAEQLVWFVSTERCLDFLEASFIGVFTARGCADGGTLSALMRSPIQDPADPPAYAKHATPPALQRLEAAHAVLLGDLAWILSSLRLRPPLVPVSVPIPTTETKMPLGFEDRPLAQKMLRLARKWVWLTCAPKAVSSNGFLMSPKR